MKAELIAVGTEILLGEITDTNTPFIARELANLGIDVYFQSTVGDNPERLKETLKLAARRSDLIILSGGLGPTEDDLTKQTVAKFLNRELIFDKSAMTKIEQYFAETKRTMTENNRLQAMYLKGALPLSNRTGFAVGIFDQEKTGPDFLLLPGPPSELEPMVSEQVIPLLKETYLSDHVLRSRMLRFFGIGESQLTTQLANLITTLCLTNGRIVENSYLFVVIVLVRSTITIQTLPLWSSVDVDSICGCEIAMPRSLPVSCLT